MKTQNIRHLATAFICALALSLAFGLISATAKAQNAESADSEYKQLSAEEQAKLRAILAEPARKDAPRAELKAQIDAKLKASLDLGIPSIILATHKEAAEVLSDSNYKNILSWKLFEEGDVEGGNYWRQRAFETATTFNGRALILVNMAHDFYQQNRTADAYQKLAEAPKMLAGATSQSDGAKRDAARTLGRLQIIKSMLQEREGKVIPAISSLNEAEKYLREALAINSRMANSNLETTYLNDWLQNTLEKKTQLLSTKGKNLDASTAVANYMRFLKETALTPRKQAQVLRHLGLMHYAQQEFMQAQNLWLRVIEMGRNHQYAENHNEMVNVQRYVANALIGQNRHPEALALFNKIDQLAGSDDKLKERVRYPFDRAVVYLYNNKALEAAPLLASSTDALAKQYGSGPAGRQHFFTAQSSGLQGVALWRMGTAESKAQAYPLLKASVRDIMAPENVDYLENVGIRKELREMIFSIYIEAATQTNPADALAALGIADWMRGGLVQEALGDAAVRAAASNASLADLVRQDQDARNEIKGLRSYLSGEAGGASSPLPQIAAQMRERIALLEKTRADVQVKIKASFPDYEKLVRPLPPSTAEIQAKLKADEALIVLQPTDDAVFVWAVNQNGTGAFHRASLSNADLVKLVKRLRSSLDVAGIAENRRPVFDHAAAQELYAKLLSPVQQGLAGKISLIVAAGGVLGQIPFGVLQTADKDSWLIKQAAITHVPSVAAWLSMRSLPHQTASQPMLAWGDPLFNIAMANTATAKGEVRKVVLTRANTAVDLEKEDPRSALKYANITPLPETRDELVAIAKTLGADAAKDLILGSAATRESVLAQNKNGNLAKQRVVAFATHGLMAGDLPNLTQPALAMAGTKDDATNVLAPLLTLEDVLTLKLNADWVVLSACNTAAADGKAEEALSGLARGFFYAGSRSLLVTHWAVDSESAVTLTTETFKNYQSKPQEAKAESLRQAMLTVMSNSATAHPTYWAPYALVGDGAR